MSSYSIKHHFLQIDGRGIPYQPTPNVGPRTIAPSLIVLHYTAGGAQGAIATLTEPKSRASAHLVVDFDGNITQLSPFSARAWHAGRSSYRGEADCNSFAVGIEIENYGLLEGEPGHWVTWFGQSVPDDQVVVAAHKSGGTERGWQRYTEAQLRTVAAICAALCEAYPAIIDIVGHDDVSPGRKVDPGPAWDWSRFRGYLEGRDSGGDQAADNAPFWGAFRCKLATTLRGAGLTYFGLDARAAKCLQRAVGTKDDGAFGKDTWSAIATYLADVAFEQYHSEQNPDDQP